MNSKEITRRDFLKIAGVGMAAATGARMAWGGPPDKQKLNIILIMADDLGYECLGCNGSTSYQTPILDELARTGARFTHCYVNPLCTPTRVPLMTGRYTFRNYTKFGHLPKGEFTFGHMMQDAGYATCAVGKWQLGPHKNDEGQGPAEAGFDEHLMKIDSDARGYADPVIYSHNSSPEPFPGKYGPDMFCEYLCDFMERHRDVPFFIYYPMFLTHFDFKPTPDSPQWQSGDRHEKDKRFYPDMVAYMDKNIGRIVSGLEKLGLRRKTLILFLGDNGTHSSIYSRMDEQTIRGGKGWLTEAGTHVPMIANCPGTIPPGRVLDALVDPTDFMATIAEATGAKPRRAPGNGILDGVSFLPLLQGQKGNPRQWILIEYIYENRNMFRGREGRYIRDHRWKLYDRGVSKRGESFYKSGQLFDMLHDPHEEYPIAPDQGSPGSQAAGRRLQAVLKKMRP